MSFDQHVNRELVDFAELVQRKCVRITSHCAAGENSDAGSLSSELSSLAARVIQDAKGEEDAHANDYDLANLETLRYSSGLSESGDSISRSVESQFEHEGRLVQIGMKYIPNTRIAGPNETLPDIAVPAIWIDGAETQWHSGFTSAWNRGMSALVVEVRAHIDRCK